MNTTSLKNTLLLLPYWSKDGGQSSYTIKYRSCSVSISGQMLSIEQARMLFPELAKRLNEVSSDEPIAIKGITHELKKFATYRIEVSSDSETVIFSPIERISVFGSNPKAVIRLDPIFSSIFGGVNTFFDTSVDAPLNARCRWVFSRLKEMFAGKRDNVSVSLLNQFLSADE